eukprot:1160160-Pelagomonas_calceolata.AAC.1
MCARVCVNVCVRACALGIGVKQLVLGPHRDTRGWHCSADRRSMSTAFALEGSMQDSLEDSLEEIP